MKLLMSAAIAALCVSGACASESARSQSENFIHTASTASFETDFTVAAEKTVNEVVCIKSYQSRRQQYGGAYDPFGMFDFFFGPQERQQPRQQHEHYPEQYLIGDFHFVAYSGSLRRSKASM